MVGAHDVIARLLIIGGGRLAGHVLP